MSKTIIATILALFAFAANSVLARLALEPPLIDPAAFTMLRLLSGAIVLFVLVFIIQPKTPETPHHLKKPKSLYDMSLSADFKVKGSWLSGLMLFLYAACFSFAYIALDTATGALILFASVQITMIIISILSGYKLHIREWAGIILAFIGFVYLIYPNIVVENVSDQLFGYLLMIISGIAWGIYTVRGKNSIEPLTDTAFNFLRAVSFTGLLIIVNLSKLSVTLDGALYAIVSGGITSGIGYAIWYIALKKLALTAASVVQLSVPMIAAFGGLIFVGEAITLRLIAAALLILGGIFVTIVGRNKSI